MFKTNSKIISMILILTVASFIMGGCGIIKVNPEAEKNLVVATVGGEEIKKGELNQMFEVFKVQYEQKYGAEVWNQEVDGKKLQDVVKEKVLDMLIDNKIQLKKAAELGITVPDAEINEELDKARTYFDTEQKFNEFLSSQKMSFDYFKESVKKDLTIKKLYEKLTENITIPDDEVANYYGSHLNEFIRVKASHILLEKEETAKEVLQKVKAGESFNELAKQYSIDPSAKENSGDLGYFKHGDMVEPFEKAAFALKPGQISDIVQTQFGFHIIKVEDSKLDKLEEVKDELKNNMLTEKKNAEYEKLLADMRTKANIKKNTKNL